MTKIIFSETMETRILLHSIDIIGSRKTFGTPVHSLVYSTTRIILLAAPCLQEMGMKSRQGLHELSRK